jgi:hypothetical protein
MHAQQLISLFAGVWCSTVFNGCRLALLHWQAPSTSGKHLLFY